jgi:hypothetical protein
MFQAAQRLELGLSLYRPVIIVVVVKASFVNTGCVFFFVQTETDVSFDEESLPKLLHEALGHEVTLP